MKRLLFAVLLFPAIASAQQQQWQVEFARGLASGAASGISQTDQSLGAALQRGLAAQRQQAIIQQQQQMQWQQQFQQQYHQNQMLNEVLAHDANQQEQNRQLIQNIYGGR